MIEGVVVINRGTAECQASIRWIKQQGFNMPIRSMCLAEDPYVNIEEVYRIANAEGIEHVTIPFKSSFISSVNVNQKKAWDFERYLKGMQYQKSLLRIATLITGTENVAFTYLVDTNRDTEYYTEVRAMVDKFRSCTKRLNDVARRGEALTHTNLVMPLEGIVTDEDFNSFVSSLEVQ
jgi:hypothetical protein